MRLLTRTDVEQACDFRYEDVPVPEWRPTAAAAGDPDPVIRLKTLTVAEHRDFSQRIKDVDDDAAICAHLLVAAAIDEAGQPVFRPADAPMLLARSAAVVKRVGRVGLKLNGLTRDAAEDLRKNSPATANSGSLSN